MSPEDSHNKAQQDKSDKTPKYPSPRLMTAAIDGRFFGFLIHYALGVCRVARGIAAEGGY
jgi:hypothetical protein